MDGVTTAASVDGVTAADFTSFAFIEQHDDELLTFFALTLVVEHVAPSAPSVAFTAVVEQWSSLADTFLAAAVVLLQHDEDDFAFFADAFSSHFTPAVATAKDAAATIAVIAIMRIFMPNSCIDVELRCLLFKRLEK